jgi:2-isopropylmalate synthase
MTHEVEIYDTTLRDGSQGEGINFSVKDKLRIADKLDAFGVHYIEGGWPGSNPKDIEFFAEAKRKKFKHARLAAFGATRRKGIAVENDQQVRLLLEAETPVITIYGKTWLLHVKEVLRSAPDENLRMIGDTIRFLKDHNHFVIYDAEHGFDGYKHDPDYAVATWQAAQQAGADLIVLCDTNGGSLPREISRIVNEARRKLTVRLGIHTHNDMGLAVANALGGLEVGATHVQGTINCYGERTGNCNLISIIPTLAFKMGKRCLPDAALYKLKELSQFVDEVANIRPDQRQPWVGEAAFAHKGGTHVNGVQKVARSYEHIDPSRIGNARRVLVSELAGCSNIAMKARELGFDLANNTPLVKEILSRVKKLEHEGYEFESAEASLALIICKTLNHTQAPFKIASFHISIRRDSLISVCRARVKVLVEDVAEYTIAEGDGPVNALDKALRKALTRFYPQLKKVRLADYKVRILDSTFGTGARTRVLIGSTDGKEEWGTVGVHDNIIEASLQALSDSLEYRLLKRRAKPRMLA